MPFYYFAWACSFLYGLYSVSAKIIGKHVLKNVYQFAFFATLFGAIFIAPITLFYGAKIPHIWTYITIAAFLFALNNFTYLMAMSKLDVSVISPLFSVKVVITLFFGFIFLGEHMTLVNSLIAAIVIFASLFASMDEKFSFKSFFSKDIAWGLVFMLVSAIQSIFINRAIAQTDYWTATLWIQVLAVPFSFFLLFPKFKNEIKKTKFSGYYTTILLALLGCFGDLAAYKAFSENVGISSIIISLPLSMVLVIILSIWKPKLLEKHSAKVYAVRLAATAIMVSGALFLSQ
jgi:uncharacterized membrane protein